MGKEGSERDVAWERHREEGARQWGHRGGRFPEVLLGRSGRCDISSKARQLGFISGSSTSWLHDLGLLTQRTILGLSFLICTAEMVVVPAS